METILVLLLFMFGMAVPTATVLAILAFSRARDLDQRLRRLEQQLAGDETSPTRTSAAPAASQPGAQAPMARAESSAAHTGLTPAAPGSRIAGQPAAATTPSDRVQPSPAAPEPRRKVQWEQWVGVRGAAVLGGLLFALAGLLFFKHALEQGWITPAMRVVTGVLVGLAALGTSELLRRRKFGYAPAALAGGGIVVLYATTWASYWLYGFIGALGALPLMALVTGACAWLSIRLRSQLVAVLGLIGGFATPIVLSMLAENPIGLFGYILLLDLGLLALGQRTKWPSLGMLGMLGTFVVELVWTLRHLDAHFYPLALASLGAFALVFAAAGMRSPASERRSWFVTQAGALLLPFAFAAYFAAITDFGDSLWPLATLIAFLAIGASWIGSKQDAKWLATGAAAGALAVTATWLSRTGISTGGLWEFAACTLGLAAVMSLAEKFFGRSASPAAESRWSVPIAPAILSLGFLVMTVLAAIFYIDTSPWPWLVVALGHALLLHFQGRLERAGPLRVIGASLAAMALGAHLIDMAHTTLPGVPGPALTATWILLFALGFVGLALQSSLRDEEREARWAWHAASAFAWVLLLLIPSSGALMGPSPALALGLTTALALCALMPAVVHGWGPWSFVVMLLFPFRRLLWASHYLQSGERDADGLFWLELAAVALLASTPLLTRRRLGESRLAWAGSGLLCLVSLGTIDWHLAVPDQAVNPWQSAAMLAALAAICGLAANHWLERTATARESALRWLFGGAVVLASLALARSLHHEVSIVAAALAGLGLAALCQRLPAIGLKLTAFAAIVCSALGLAVRVLFGLGGESYFANAPQVLWNWTSYASGVPTLCALGAALLIGRSESQRAHALERRAPLRGRAWAASSLGLLAALLAFVWLNLQVLLYFEPGEFLRFDLSSLPERDLTLSIAWILYALLLLAVGMARKVSGLRHISLAFLLLTLMKVFLHDLGDLEGLYRVGSLFGLAISLLAVSLLYQRLVFPRRSE